MKKNRELTFALLCDIEGWKYVNDPNDAGGATKLGITLWTMKRLGLDLDRDGDVDEQDVRLVNVDVAKKVFFEEYWDAINADDLPHGIDILASDFVYNSGVGNLQYVIDNDVKKFLINRVWWYLRLANKKQKNRGFLRGWLNRLKKLDTAINL